jgi:hypothetical protein
MKDYILPGGNGKTSDFEGSQAGSVTIPVRVDWEKSKTLGRGK